MREHGVADRGIRRQWSCLVALGSIVATGCSSSTAPSPPAAPNLRTLQTIQVSGVAFDDDGAPVPGVTVLIFPADVGGQRAAPVTTLTDANGTYSIALDTLCLPGCVNPGVSIQTEKNGYESDPHYGPLSGSPGASTFMQDLRIYRIRYVPVGQSVTIDVKPGDPNCDPGDEYGPTCRAVHITGPPGAMVAIQASASPSTTQAQIRVDETSTTCCSLATTASVPANGEIRVYLEMHWPASLMTHSFTLTNAILP